MEFLLESSDRETATHVPLAVRAARDDFASI